MTGRGLATTLSGLAPDTEYEVQVRAVNAEGTGDWSASGLGSTGGNTPATGAPAISGVLMQGQTLTAGPGTLTDANGLTNATYTYQWLRGGALIAGATARTYELTASDVGATLQVRLSFDDDEGFEEVHTSASTPVVEALPVVSIAAVDAEVEEGESAAFTVSRSGSESVRVALTASLTVSESEAMVAAGDEGARTVSFAVGADTATLGVSTEEDEAHEADSTVTATVTAGAGYTASGGAGTAQVVVTDDDNAPATGAPTIAGTPWVGYRLTAGVDGIADANGLANATHAYQWQADGTAIAGATAPEYILADAEQGKRITVEVRFTDDDGFAERLTSASLGPVLDVPDAPSGLAAAVAGDVLRLSWTAPEDTGGTPVTDYQYQVNLSGEWVPVGGASTSVLTELSAYQGYSLRVRALNAVGAGPPSEWESYASSAGVPASAPSGLAAARGDRQVTLTWTTPSDDGGAPITDYEYEVDGSGEWVSTGGTATTYTVADLVNGTTYSFEVRALNAVGASPGSGPITATPATVPGAPSGLSASRGNGEVTLRWSAPSDDGGLAVTGYEVHRGDTDTWTDVGNVTSRTVTGLSNGTEYTFEVRASNDVGAGAASGPVSETPARLPDAPTGLTAVAGNGEVTLTWTAPLDKGGSAVTGYEVHRSDTDTWTDVGNVTSHAVTGLANGTEYTFKVRAVNDVGAGAASGPASATPNRAPGYAAPAVARSVPENSPANTAVGEPVTAADADGDPLTYTLGGADASSFAVDASSGQLRTVSGVVYDHEAQSSYSVTVEAADGHGGAATVAVTITVTDVAEPPVAPAAPAVAAAGLRRVTVTWTAPANDGRPAIDDYDVQYRVSSGGAFTDALYDGTGLATTLTDLEPGTEYEVQVRAGNAEGAGSWSASGLGSTGANTPATGAPTITGTLLVGETLAAGVGDIADANGLANATYIYQWLRDGALIAGATGQTYTPTAADADATLQIRVSFTDDEGFDETRTSVATAPVEGLPVVSVEGPGGSVTEGGEAVFTLTRTGTLSLARGLDVSVEVSETGAMVPASAEGSRAVSFGANEGRVTYAVATDGDTVDEANSEVTLTVEAAAGYGVSSSAGAASVTVTDDDDAAFTVTADPESVAEADGTATVTVSTRGATFAEDREIALSLGGTATRDTDYTVSSETLTLPAGATSVEATVTALDDEVDEDAETVVVGAEGAEGDGDDHGRRRTGACR